MKIEKFRKKPAVVDTLLWDGTTERLEQIKTFVGQGGGHHTMVLFNEQSGLRIWNEQEICYIECPVGHRVVKGVLGEFYPISPQAVAETYEQVTA